MLTSYHLRYVDKWYANILLKTWYVDIYAMYVDKRFATVDIHHDIMVCKHLIIQSMLINGMLTSNYICYQHSLWYVDI